ncbi:hypothetical protein S245_002478, partial [Arachis hypogaea]
GSSTHTTATIYMALATCLTSILLQDDHDHHLRKQINAEESKDPVVQFLEGELLIVCLYSNPGGRFASREKMSLLSSKELPKFSVKHFLHSSGHVAAKFQYDQVSHANFIKSIELYISIENFEFSIIRGYVFDLEQIPAYSCFIGYVSWQVMDVPAFFLIRSREGSRRNI